MTRPGIALYGIHPFENLANPLQPVFDWQARILQIRNAAAGDTVGYGGTYQLDRDSQIATLGVGYADGLHTGSASLVHADYRVEKMASDIGTIPYEIMTSLGRRAERHYLGGG